MNYKLTLTLLIITFAITSCSDNSKQLETSPPIDKSTIESVGTPPQVNPNISSENDIASQVHPNSNPSVDTSPQVIAKNDGVTQNSYDVSCIDKILGGKITDSIVYGGINSTPEQFAKIQNCKLNLVGKKTNQDQEINPNQSLQANPPQQNHTPTPVPTQEATYNTGSTAPTTSSGNKNIDTNQNFNPSKDSPNPNDQPQLNENNGNDNLEIENWRELYQIPYKTSCMNDRLGIEVVRKFQTGDRGPTDTELQSVQSCEVERADLLPNDDPRKDTPDQGEDENEDVRARIEQIKIHSGSWIRTGDRTMDQFVLGYVPTPDEWRCGVAAVGAGILRSIKAGTHLITDEENQKLTPCFRASPDSLTHPLTQFDCVPLDILLEYVDYYRPSWEQLECHIGDLERYDLPKQVRGSGVGIPFGVRNMKGPLYPPLWDRVLNDPYFEEFKLNVSPATANMGLPPSYDEEYNSMKCPQAILDSTGKYKLDEYWLSEEIRGAAIGYIIEKKKGLRVYADLDMCTNAYIVQGNPEDYKIHINSVQDFKDFTLNVTIPAYRMKAKAAEKVKVEWMQLNAYGNSEIEVPFSVEPVLYNLPTSQQVELAQWYLDLIIEEVREHFNGTIWIASYANYDSGHPDYLATGMNPTFGPHWKQLSFANADHVSFTADSSCDFFHVKRYFTIQFDAYMEIVERDNVTWSILPSIGRDSFGPDYVRGCADEYDEKKVEMHEWMLSKLDEQPTQPYFLFGIPPHPRSWTKDEEGWYPTEENADRGDWKLFNIDMQQPDPEVKELYVNYALTHIIE